MQSRVLETAIGLVFVWLSASLIVSGIVEGIASLIRMRAKDLEGAVTRMLGSNERIQLFVDKIAAFDLGKKIASFNVGSGARAATTRFAKSIPSPAFADAILRMENHLDDAPVAEVVATLRAEAGDDATKVRVELEKWFDHQMEFVSAEYKRRARWISAIAGLVVAIVLGLDTFGVAARLYESKDIRDSLVSASSQFTKTPNPVAGCVTRTTMTGDTTSTSTTTKTSTSATSTTTPGDALKAQVQCIGDIASQLTDLKLTTPPLAPWTNICDWFLRRIHHGWGILATAAAIGAGSSFWFRLLKKLLGLRKTKAA